VTVDEEYKMSPKMVQQEKESGNVSLEDDEDSKEEEAPKVI
jgi:hypothetical protein